MHCPEDHIALQLKEGETAVADRWGDTQDSRHKIIAGERVEFVPVEVSTSVSILRARAYPSVKDQLDALWHAMDKGVLPMVADFYQPIAEVKTKYTKGS